MHEKGFALDFKVTELVMLPDTFLALFLAFFFPDSRVCYNHPANSS